MAEATEAARQVPSASAKERESTSSLRRLFSPRNIGAIYVWLALIVVFSILAPESFPSLDTVRALVNQYSIEGLAALAIVIPLATRMFDLSIGANVGVSGVLAGFLLDRTDLAGGAVIALVLCAGLLIGALNIFVVVWLRVDSFIGTLATGSILGAIALGLSGGNIFSVGVSESLSAYITRPSIAGFTLPVVYMLVTMLIIGFVLEQTVTGRRLYATGFDPEVARLAGIRIDRMRSLALLVSGLIGSIAGLALVARIGAADPTQGPSYLLTAFAAAFVGATQFRSGRFNPWGTVVAVLMLGTGNIGLIMSGGPVWTPALFNGIVLILAMAFTYSNDQGEGEGLVDRLKSLVRRNDEP